MNVSTWGGRAVAAASVLAVSGLLAGCGDGPSLFELGAGDCLNSSDITSEKVLDVEVLRCSTSHDLEVYAETEMEGEEFPGRDTTSVFAENFCFSQFEEFVGIPYEQSQLSFNWLYPSRDSWETSGDRRVLCLLQSPEPVSRSLEGSGR